MVDNQTDYDENLQNSQKNYINNNNHFENQDQELYAAIRRNDVPPTVKTSTHKEKMI